MYRFQDSDLCKTFVGLKELQLVEERLLKIFVVVYVKRPKKCEESAHQRTESGEGASSESLRVEGSVVCQLC